MPRLPILLVATIALALTVASAPAAAAPANDAFADRSSVSALPFTATIDTTTATSEVGEPRPCGPSVRTVWYSFTAPTTALHQIDTLGSNFDTVLAVYTGTELTSLTDVACHDDSEANRQSRVLFPATAGVEYLVQAGGFDQASGSLVVNITQAPPAPLNDDFADAFAATALPFTDQRLTASAGEEDLELFTTCSDVEKTVWYTLIPAATATYQLDTIGSDFDTVLTIYTGSALGSLTQVDCNDDIEGGEVLVAQSLVQATLSAGVTYRIQVGGFSLFQGGFAADYGALTFNVADIAADTDGDGCNDIRETGTDPKPGGGRDPRDPWDFYDVNDDRIIDLQDTLLILEHFGHAPGTDALDASLDRYAPDPSKPYRTAAATPANDGIDLLDALTNLDSFGHSCV